mmetsp:Transcript_59927/g.190367  ORF Transcript_59927/g.190367 Transcript_59927/m.190367 type:complete len:573 (+) Transcript_59927:174-1892(+)
MFDTCEGHVVAASARPGGLRGVRFGRGTTPSVFASLGARRGSCNDTTPPAEAFCRRENASGGAMEGRRRRRQPAVFASLSMRGRSTRDLKQMFDEIDLDGSGTVNEGELRAYAQRKGLPQQYVLKFIQNSSAKGQSATQVTFNEFAGFINSTEDSLRTTFRAIDLDGDGRISVSELQEALSRASSYCTQKCPSNRRTTCNVKSTCVEGMLKRVNPSGGSVTFSQFRDFFLLVPSNDVMYKYWADSSSACDIANNTQVLGHKPSQKGAQSPWGHLIAGASAGAVSRTVTAPLETLRVTMMLDQSGAKKNVVMAAQDIYRRGGMRALFMGNGVNVLRSAPQKAIDFFAFEALKATLSRGAPLTSANTLAAGAMAGACSNVVLYPLDTIRSRLTVDTAGQYKGIGGALRKVAKSEGTGSLYRGLPTSVMAILPEAAITYGMYDILRKTYKRVRGEEAGVLPSLCAGVTSAFTGQLVAYPFELVARRLQVQKAVSGGAVAKYVNVFDAIPIIAREEGYGALYKGIVPASIKVIPMAAVSFSVYEAVRFQLLRLEELRDAAEKKKLQAKEVLDQRVA